MAPLGAVWCYAISRFVVWCYAILSPIIGRTDRTDRHLSTPPTVSLKISSGSQSVMIRNDPIRITGEDRKAWQWTNNWQLATHPALISAGTLNSHQWRTAHWHTIGLPAHWHMCTLNAHQWHTDTRKGTPDTPMVH